MNWKAFTLAVTYLIYIIIWDCGLIAGCSYLVFYKGHSGWWFLLAIYLAGSCMKPKHWAELFYPNTININKNERSAS